MAHTLKLEIVTPEGVAFSEDVELVTLPGIEGEMGIYPDHVPLLTQVVPGELVAKKGAQDLAMAVGEGFVQVTGDRVSILTDLAISAEADEAEAEAARKRAEERVRERLGGEESAAVEASILRTFSQLKSKRRPR